MRLFLWTAATAADVSVLLLVYLAAASWLSLARAWRSGLHSRCVSPSICSISRRAASQGLLKPIASTADHHWTPSKAVIIALSTSMVFLSVSTVSVAVIDGYSNTVSAAVMDVSSNTALLGQSRAKKEDSAVLKLRNGLISGAATRAAKELALHPIETVKARVQMLPRSNVSSSGASLYWDGGLYRGVYDGVVPALLGGLPAGAVFFGAKDFIKEALQLNPSSLTLSREMRTIVAVAAANVPYWIVRTPSEALKTRDQVRRTTLDLGTAADSTRRTALEELRDQWRQRGLQGVWGALYGSYFSNLAYALPADIIKFVAYEKLSSWVSADSKLDGLEAACIGALASLAAQLATTPLDVARTRIMVSDGAGTSRNPLQVAGTILREEGLILGLYRGTLPRVIRAILSGAVQFATYEITQSYLQK